MAPSLRALACPCVPMLETTLVDVDDKRIEVKRGKTDVAMVASAQQIKSLKSWGKRSKVKGLRQGIFSAAVKAGRLKSVFLWLAALKKKKRGASLHSAVRSIKDKKN